MNGLANEARKTLEIEVVNATLTASNQILSCAVINRIINLLHLKNNASAAVIATLMLSTLIFVFAWLMNALVGLPISLMSNWPLIIPALLAGLAFFIVKVLHDSILPPNRERIARFPADTDSLLAFRNWFKKGFRVRRQIAFSIFFAVFAVLTTRILSRDFPTLQTNLGLYVGVFCGIFAIGNGGYCAWIIPTLASTGSSCRMNLFPYNPASTTAIRIASAGFGKLALANGIVATLVILLIFAFRPWQGRMTLQIALIWLLVGWGVVTYSFAFPQYHLAKIISQEKHRQIERLEVLIEAYHNRLEDLSDKEIDKMQKLIDLRDRIFMSNDSAIDLGAWRDYISSIVLPLASFVTGVINIPEMIKDLL